MSQMLGPSSNADQKLFAQNVKKKKKNNNNNNNKIKHIYYMNMENPMKKCSSMLLKDFIHV